MRYLLPTARPIAEDLAGTLTFYLLYLLTGSARLAAAVGLAIGFIQIAWHLRRGQRVPVLLATGVALTAVLGGLTLLTADARFLLIKPSIIYLAIGLPMLPRGWVRRYVPPLALELLPARTFDRVGWSWAALLLGSAALNLVLVATVPPATAAAVFAIWGIVSKLTLFAVQYISLRVRAKRKLLARNQGGSLGASPEHAKTNTCMRDNPMTRSCSARAEPD